MSEFTPTTPAAFYNFKEEIITVPLITLMVWTAGMRLRCKTGEDIAGVEKVVRRYLKTPKGYRASHILEHLQAVLDETKAHYGLTDAPRLTPEQKDLHRDPGELPAPPECFKPKTDKEMCKK